MGFFLHIRIWKNFTKFVTQTDKTMALQSVMMLQIGDKTEFYSTPTALFSEHTAEELGITRESLNNHFSRLGDKETKLYSNDKCTIIRGALKCGSRK